MGVLKRIKNIETQITSFNNSTLRKANGLQRQNELLSQLRVNVKNAIVMQDPNTSRYKVRIEYSVPIAEIYLDEENRETVNEMVKALNLLNIVPVRDQILIGKRIQEAKEKNKR